MKRLIVLTILAAALLGTTTASAATIDDLRALGFTVSVSSQLPGPNSTLCNVYYISGFGNSSYFNECDPNFQSAIDSWANPVGLCNVKWQYEHPDQLAAFMSIIAKGYSLTGDQCADTYTVTNPAANTVVYSGSGAGLPGVNDQLPQAPAPSQQTAGPSAGGQSFCLPLCPNLGDTRGGGGVLIAGGGVLVTSSATPLTALSAVAPFNDPNVAAAAAAILFPDNSAGYLIRAGYGHDGALAPSP